MKFTGLILASSAWLAVAAAPIAGLCDEIKGTKPDQWLACYAATKLHQDAIAATGRAPLAVVLKSGEPRIAYQRLTRQYLIGFKKLDTEAAAAVMIKAPAEMKKTSSAPEIEDLARSCTLNLPDLSNPMFYAEYPFLAD